MSTPTIQASAAQVRFLTSLAEEAAALDPDNLGDAVAKVEAWLPGRTRPQVSQAIDSAKQTIRELKATSGKNVPEGIHRLGDAIFKVQVAVHGSGRKYAKRLIVGESEGSWAYEAGAVNLLTEDTLMSLEEAQEFGALYGFCVRCGATLTDEESIARGIGPVCATRF